MEKCDGDLRIENRKKTEMVKELVRRGYNSDPVKAWKLIQDRESVLVINYLCLLLNEKKMDYLHFFLLIFSWMKLSKELLKKQKKMKVLHQLVQPQPKMMRI